MQTWFTESQIWGWGQLTARDTRASIVQQKGMVTDICCCVHQSPGLDHTGMAGTCMAPHCCVQHVVMTLC